MARGDKELIVTPCRQPQETVAEPASVCIKIFCFLLELIFQFLLSYLKVANGSNRHGYGVSIQNL